MQLSEVFVVGFLLGAASASRVLSRDGRASDPEVDMETVRISLRIKNHVIILLRIDGDTGKHIGTSSNNNYFAFGLLLKGMSGHHVTG